MARRRVQELSSWSSVNSFLRGGNLSCSSDCSRVVTRLGEMFSASLRILFNTWVIDCCYCLFLFPERSDASMRVNRSMTSSRMPLSSGMACEFRCNGTRRSSKICSHINLIVSLSIVGWPYSGFDSLSGLVRLLTE